MKSINILNEEFNLMLNEELHSFEDQYRLSNELSYVIYDMIKSNINNNIYKTSNNKTIQTVDISLTIISHGMFSASILGLDEEKRKIIINIVIPENKVIINDIQYIINELSNVIAHELMHGNIFFNRLSNKLEIEDYPDYYLPSINIIRNESPQTFAYDVAYALYATYYQETSALISQTVTDIKTMMEEENITKPTNNDIKRLIKNTQSYAVFKNIIINLVPQLKYGDDDILYGVVKKFQKYNFNADINFFKNKANYLEKIANVAIKKILRNAMLILKFIN